MNIVDWLKKEAELVALDRLLEAAAEIERLTAENERLRKPAKDCYHIEGCPHWVEVCQRAAKAEAQNERLRNIAADLMDLVAEMPIKHPQQSTRRKILRGQCEQFGITQQLSVNSEPEDCPECGGIGFTDQPCDKCGGDF